MVVVVVGCGIESAMLMSSIIDACDSTCATYVQEDSVEFEIHNCYPCEEDLILKREDDKPHYRDLEYKHKKKRF